MSKKDDIAISYAFADMAMHGRGFTRMKDGKIEHIPYHDVMGDGVALKSAIVPRDTLFGQSLEAEALGMRLVEQATCKYAKAHSPGITCRECGYTPPTFGSES